jgi:Ni/Co efflux regulator RcnB
MRKTITALLATAALVGSSGAIAGGWQGNHGNDKNGNNSGQSSSNQGWHGRGDSGSGNHGQSESRVQSQNNGAGDRPHWDRSTLQAGSTFSGQGNAQGGHDDHARQVLSNDHPHWNGGDNGHGQWNGNDGDNARHYHQDESGHWNDGDHGNHEQWQGDHHDDHGWNRGEHHDDWRAFRNGNRDRFHLPRYIGPRGYSYRRFDRGYTIDPFFYSQQYWIDDPYEYHLPPAYGPYRWVRYFNDALLIDVRNGEVEDVIYDFFW